MSVAGYADLLAHVGHDIEVATYGTFPASYGPEDAERVRKSYPVNVAIECLDCSVVLLDYDAPEAEHVHDAAECCECGGNHCCCQCPVFEA